MRLTSLALIAISASVAQAQQQSPAVATSGGTTTGSRVAVRPLGDVVATAAESLGTVAGVRALPGGGVLVNDLSRRRVVMFDGTLASPTVIVDSASGAVNSYGPQPGGLIAYRGDSTLFVDPVSLSMLVIDPKGAVARVMSVPRSDDARALSGAIGANAGFDAKGRMIYRGFPRFTIGGPRGAGAPGAGGTAARGGTAGGAPPSGASGAAAMLAQMPSPPDTMPLLRVDLASRAVDTIAWIKVPRPNINVTTDENGQPQVRVVMNPLPTVDEWTVTSDGAVALVRGRDYHIDWVNPDGSTTAGARMAFDWKRMSDEDKEAFIDSLKAVRARQGANAPMPMVNGMPGGAGGGAPQVVMRTEVMGGGQGAPPRSEARTTTSSPSNMEFVPASDLPDYRPAFFAGAVRADLQGNVWIRTTAAPTVTGATVWDVVDRKGTVVDRVQVPAGRTIIGFGTDGTALLSSREGMNTKLEKAKLR